MRRSVKRYQNAAQLLPKPLLKELQHYAAGKMLYVPHPITRREFNRLKVLDLRMQGYSPTEIRDRPPPGDESVKCHAHPADRPAASTGYLCLPF